MPDRLLVVILLILVSLVTKGQDNRLFVDDVIVSGNKKTKTRIILREMNVHAGDTLLMVSLPQLLEENRLQILNTGLFNEVSINVKSWKDQHIELAVTVKEGWYLVPYPIFELADRNFNVWWVEQERSLDRINYGLRTSWNNFTGNYDYLKTTIQFGYTQKFEVDYTIPYLNKAQTIGLNINALYSRNEEVAYRTFENRLQFYRSETDFLFTRRRFGAGVLYRPKLWAFHRFYIQHHRYGITEEVARDLNRDFFLDGRISQQFVKLRYEFTLDRRDNRPYPKKGFLLRVKVEKDGLGIYEDRNTLSLYSQFGKFLKLGKKWSLEAYLTGRVSLIREPQAYYNYRGLGYLEDYLRGYEYYVLDGLDYAYAKMGWRYPIFNRIANFEKWVPIPQFQEIPIKMYFRLNADWGYVNSPFYNTTNDFVNRSLLGVGPGLDIIAYYTNLFQIEYSFNHLLEGGIFLHWKTRF